MNIAVFEDNDVQLLYPVTTGRPAYAISCGGYRLIDWLRLLSGKLVGIVRTHLRTIQLMDYEFLGTQLDESLPWTLLVNARLVPSHSNFAGLQQLAGLQQATLVRHEWSLAAALLPTAAVRAQCQGAALSQIEQFCNDSAADCQTLDLKMPLFCFPHELIGANAGAIGDNLAHRLEGGSYHEIADGVFAAEGATLGPYTICDTRNGPIVLDRHAQIGPHCYLRGPAYVGAHSRVIEHSAIKDAVSIGHTAKIGGEVEASVIEPYTNKQHHGFLGHSYLGSWINLGAGTCNSDLKNTYGEVKMDYRGEKIHTGMQFVGCIVGDYAKTAINTGIFTGKTVGTCSMVYGFVTTNVPSFVNYARSFGQVTELPPSVMVSTQKRMFERRCVQQRPCDVQLIYDAYELTRHERQLAEEPLVL